MAKASLYDEFLTSEKIADLSHIAFRLYVLSIVYAGKELTDGEITQRALRSLVVWVGCPVGKAASELVTAGCWEQTDSGYLIHDYLEHNPSRAEILEFRASNARRQQALRDRRRHIENEIATSLTGSQSETEEEHHVERNALRNGGSHAALPKPSPNSKGVEHSPPTPPAPINGRGHDGVWRGHDAFASGKLSELLDVVGATPEHEKKLARAARGVPLAGIVAALEAANGPGVQSRIAVALSTLARRKTDVSTRTRVA